MKVHFDYGGGVLPGEKKLRFDDSELDLASSYLGLAADLTEASNRRYINLRLGASSRRCLPRQSTTALISTA